MDRTLEFRSLLKGPTSAQAEPCSVFIRAAIEQKEEVNHIRCCLKTDQKQASAIQACNDRMSELEPLVEDTSGLESWSGGMFRDLFEHRRCVIRALYEELRQLTSTVQTEQVRDIQREHEVSSFFAPSLTKVSSALKPPVPEVDPSVWRTGGHAADLEREQEHLLTTFHSDLDRIAETQAKLEEVSSLVGLFGNKAMEHLEMAEQIQETAEQSTAAIEDATRHLTKAVENSNSYRFYVVCWFVGSAVSLLLFDFIDAYFSWI